jgi:hypothetical protein
VYLRSTADIHWVNAEQLSIFDDPHRHAWHRLIDFVRGPRGSAERRSSPFTVLEAKAATTASPENQSFAEQFLYLSEPRLFDLSPTDSPEARRELAERFQASDEHLDSARRKVEEARSDLRRLGKTRRYRRQVAHAPSS